MKQETLFICNLHANKMGSRIVAGHHLCGRQAIGKIRHPLPVRGVGRKG
jgi:hypothetical protein